MNIRTSATSSKNEDSFCTCSSIQDCSTRSLNGTKLTMNVLKQEMSMCIVFFFMILRNLGLKFDLPMISS